MRRWKTLVSAVGCPILLAACVGGQPAWPSSFQTTPTVPARTTAKGMLHIRVSIPKRKRDRGRFRSKYISPSTQGMTIALSGPSTLDETIGLTQSSPGCSASASGTTCTIGVVLEPCSSAAVCYTGVVVTYDKVDCVAEECAIPPGAHALSANQEVAFSVTTGQNNSLDLTLDGIPESVAIAPLPGSGLVATSSTKFTISKCVTTPQNVNVIGVDADGNDIVGPGAPTSPALTSDDTTNLAVATPAPASPNTFQLVPPSTLASATIPNAGKVVHLTASVTPLAGSGAATASSKIDVTFNSDVCGVMTEYPLKTSGSNPDGITAGPDDSLWFTEKSNNKIGRITTDGKITEYSITTAGSQPVGIALGGDGALWFSEFNGNNIGRIQTNGVITNQFTIPTSGSGSLGIAAGPGGLWFAENTSGNIGKVTVGGTFSKYPIASTPNGPDGIAEGSNDAIWFTQQAGNAISQITTSGTISTYALPETGSAPEGIVAGPDGALWFTECAGGRIGRITTAGAITETSIPTSASGPKAIAPGPDGALWFTESPGYIGRITTAGAITNEYTIATTPNLPSGIVAGPDGALWFTEFCGNMIGRLQ